MLGSTLAKSRSSTSVRTCTTGTPATALDPLVPGGAESGTAAVAEGVAGGVLVFALPAAAAGMDASGTRLPRSFADVAAGVLARVPAAVVAPGGGA